MVRLTFFCSLPCHTQPLVNKGFELFPARPRVTPFVSDGFVTIFLSHPPFFIQDNFPTHGHRFETHTDPAGHDPATDG